ncbi:MAG: type I restriction enzyme HsdR N-terminal domain-containing protein [Bacteroidia bacterium]|nr:type I restriction enzyme HsdR N-terminal domain-containing protein [Bacteroidia bacterium]
MLPLLNLPEANLKLKAPTTPKGKPQVWDVCRKQYVTLTPEEYVRQSFLSYLLNVLGYPRERTAVEAALNINGQSHRADIVIYDINMSPLLIVECKAPTVQISQKTLDQALRYNTQLGVKYIVLTNGLRHYCIGVDSQKYSILSHIPPYLKG